MSSKNSRIILVKVSLIALSTLVSSCAAATRVAGEAGETVVQNLGKNTNLASKAVTSTNRASKAATDVTRLNDELANSAKLKDLRPIVSGAAGGGVVVTASLLIGQNAYGEVRYNCKSGKLYLPPLSSNAPKVNHNTMRNQMKLSCGRG